MLKMQGIIGFRFVVSRLHRDISPRRKPHFWGFLLSRQQSFPSPIQLHKFETLTPDVIVMTHRATTKGMQDGKEVTESHRSLHVFQSRDGQWQVVANAQLPIKD